MTPEERLIAILKARKLIPVTRGVLDAATQAIREAVAEERERRDELIDGLQGALLACEKACWKEGQTVNGLNRDIRRAVAQFIEDAGKQQEARIRSASDE